MTRADWILLVVIAAVLPLLYYGLWSGHGPGRTVRIQAGGEPARVVALDRNRRLHIPGPRGESVVEVRAGKVRFADSPCERRYCVHSGWLSEAGEGAACLPNRVSLSVEGGPRRFDAINF